MVNGILLFAALLAGLAFLFTMIRFVKGPSAADRVVAFDVTTIVAITFIVFAAINEGRKIYLDVALVYALLSFLGVIAVARYLELTGSEQTGFEDKAGSHKSHACKSGEHSDNSVEGASK